MTKFKNILNKIRPEEWLALSVFVVVTSINTFVYPRNISLYNAVGMMLKYFTFGDPFYYLFFGVICFMAVLIFYANASKLVTDWVVEKKRPTKERIKEILVKIFSPLRYILPLWLISGPVYLLLSNISYELRFTKTDITLAQIDSAFFHKLFFIDLATKYNTEIFGFFMYVSYVSLATVMGVCLLILLFLNKKYILRLAITSFLFSNIFAYSIYYFVPAQGPLYALIYNKRNIDIPQELQVKLDTYKPSLYTTKINENILSYYVNKDLDDSSPVSSFPSMHAMWSFILIYFFWRLWKHSIFITIPWAFFVLMGGLYFAQHFFIDYIASIPLAILCIVFAHMLLKQKD